VREANVSLVRYLLEKDADGVPVGREGGRKGRFRLVKERRYRAESLAEGNTDSMHVAAMSTIRELLARAKQQALEAVVEGEERNRREGGKEGGGKEGEGGGGREGGGDYEEEEGGGGWREGGRDRGREGEGDAAYGVAACEEGGGRRRRRRRGRGKAGG